MQDYFPESSVKREDLDYYIHKAVEEQVEITITCTPESTEITIRPWKPVTSTYTTTC